MREAKDIMEEIDQKVRVSKVKEKDLETMTPTRTDEIGSCTKSFAPEATERIASAAPGRLKITFADDENEFEINTDAWISPLGDSVAITMFSDDSTKDDDLADGKSKQNENAWCEENCDLVLNRWSGKVAIEENQCKKCGMTMMERNSRELIGNRSRSYKTGRYEKTNEVSSVAVKKDSERLMTSRRAYTQRS
jgi:hypothetical protein